MCGGSSRQSLAPLPGEVGSHSEDPQRDPTRDWRHRGHLPHTLRPVPGHRDHPGCGEGCVGTLLGEPASAGPRQGCPGRAGLRFCYSPASPPDPPPQRCLQRAEPPSLGPSPSLLPPLGRPRSADAVSEPGAHASGFFLSLFCNIVFSPLLSLPLPLASLLLLLPLPTPSPSAAPARQERQEGPERSGAERSGQRRGWGAAQRDRGPSAPPCAPPCAPPSAAPSAASSGSSWCSALRTQVGPRFPSLRFPEFSYRGERGAKPRRVAKLWLGDPPGRAPRGGGGGTPAAAPRRAEGAASL